jgi:hypothetical protein
MGQIEVKGQIVCRRIFKRAGEIFWFNNPSTGPDKLFDKAGCAMLIWYPRNQGVPNAREGKWIREKY